jgi:hypothetical protein
LPRHESRSQPTISPSPIPHRAAGLTSTLDPQCLILIVAAVSTSRLLSARLGDDE